MRGLRRAALALGIGALCALAVKLRASGSAPLASGGWRELTAEDLARGALAGPDEGMTA